MRARAEPGHEGDMGVGRRLRPGVWCLAVVLGACSLTSLDEPGPPTLPPTGVDVADGTTTATTWTIGPPESQGFDTLVLADTLSSFVEDTPGLHAVVLVRHGAVVLDAAFFPYDGTTPHGIGSITRVVTIAMLGVAEDRGLLQLDDPVVSFFPERTIANRDARKDRITLHDLASMTSGFDCAALGEEASVRGMTATEDWVGYALDLPMADEPGTTFRSCGPGTHLLAAALERATGVSPAEFTQQFLFEPLGISAVRWSTDPSGLPWGSGGLALRPEDLAKLGVLWANDGRWDGRQVLDPTWVAAMTDGGPVETASGDAYGLGWWVPRDRAHGTYRAFGYGGQLLMVREDLGLVAVVLGSGVVPETVVDRLVTALVSDEAPLLGDDLGERRLAVVSAEVAAAPEAVGATGPETTIRKVAGRTWSIAANPYGLATLRLDLDGGKPAGTMTMRFTDGPLEQVLPLGLDGVPRIGLDRHRRPVASRGWWSDSRTIVLDIDEVVDGRAIMLRVRFSKSYGAITIDGQERGHDAGFVVEGSRDR